MSSSASFRFPGRCGKRVDRAVRSPMWNGATLGATTLSLVAGANADMPDVRVRLEDGSCASSHGDVRYTPKPDIGSRCSEGAP